jgi:hypothetical protein
MIDMNPIMAKNNTIVTLHLDDEESSSERLAPYGELHKDDASSLHRVAPHALKCHVGLHELIVLPSKLLEDGVWNHVDGSASIDEHSGDRLFIMCPQTYNDFICWLDSSGFLNMASLGLRHI